MALDFNMTEQEILDHLEEICCTEDFKKIFPVQRLSPLRRRRDPCRRTERIKAYAIAVRSWGGTLTSTRRPIRWCVSKQVSFGDGWSATT